VPGQSRVTALLQLLWLALPVLSSGLVHLAVMRKDWLPSLRRAPLDFGMTFRGHRVFGANKTWRGAIVTVLCTACFAALLAWVNARWLQWPVAVPFAEAHPFVWGALLGSGYIAGELPNSFIKRQLDIAPGAAGSGIAGRFFWLVDQLDSLAGMLLFTWPVWKPSPGLIAGLVALMLVAHPVAAWVMMLAGLKKRVG
jgi:hypothetical protein